jgi:hypothetical protein
MSQDAINQTTRHAKRRRVVGAGSCSGCSWSGVTALVKRDDGVWCYECALTRDGKSTTEAHHFLGRANDPVTVPVPGNVHRELSDAMMDWPTELKTNPERDPLIWLSQACRGMGDHLQFWVQRLKAIAAWLVSLSAALRESHGASWWTTLALPSLWDAVAS